MTTQEYLQETFNITIQEASDFILANYENNLQSIYNICLNNGITNSMLADILENTIEGITKEDIQTFFDLKGFNGVALDYNNQEFQVNSETYLDQVYTSITELHNGNFVIAWQSYDTEGSGITDDSDSHIAAQIYDRTGERIGSEFQVNSEIGYQQNNPVMVTLNNGNFLVVWTSFDTDGVNITDESVTYLAGQIFDSNGNKIGSEFQINSETEGVQGFPEITKLSNGNLVVTWASSDTEGNGITDTSQTHIAAQIFSETGAKIGSEFQVNTDTLNYQKQPTITALSNGNFVVAWENDNTNEKEGITDTSVSYIAAQIFTSSGEKVGDEFQVNTQVEYAQRSPGITELNDGGFVITWTSEEQVQGSSDETTNIKAQIFSSNGTMIGSEFQVNTNNNDDQDSPTVATLDNGTFVVTWMSKDLGGSGITDDSVSYIAAQIFDATGTKIGDEFQVNSETYGMQNHSFVEALQNGGFLISWESYDTYGLGISDSVYYHIAGRAFDANGNAISLLEYPNLEPDIVALSMQNDDFLLIA